MRYRKLKPNHRTRMPGAIITVDTESFEVPSDANPSIKTYPLRLGVARFCRLECGRVTRRHELRFAEASVFWAWVRDRMDSERTTWLWAHNLGWDLTVLRFWRELEEGGFTLNGPWRCHVNPDTGEKERKQTPGVLITKDPPTAFCVWDKLLRKLKGCDTFNWFPESLASLGDMVRVPKMKMPGFDDPDKDWFEYCANDCLITELAVLAIIDLLKSNDFGNIRYTAASQSMSIFRHVTKPLDVRIHADPGLCEFERRSYYAGRRHVFFRGEVRRSDYFALEGEDQAEETRPIIYTGPVYSLDITACYPAVMRHNKYPFQFTRMLQEINPLRLQALMEHEGACAWVLLESYNEPWPVRTPEGVSWMTGNFQTALCGPELVRALQHGAVQWVFQVSLYNLANLFTQFVDRMIDVESRYPRDVEPVRRQLVKTMRNSLHGKFGQRGLRWETMPGYVHFEPWGMFTVPANGGKGYEWRRSIGYTVQRQVDNEVSQDTFPIIAAYTSAYARELMRSLIGEAGTDNVFYLDTDSIHVSQPGFERLMSKGLICDKEAGKLRVTGKADIVRYYAPKHYIWDGEVINAGLPHRARKLPDGRYSTDKFYRTEHYIHNNPPQGGQVIVEEMDAPHHSVGARVDPDGWTRPLVYSV